MSFDKIEVRVFSGPDQVQVGSNTEPDLIVMNIGPKGDTGATGNTGATGPAGPNSVTSATTSDGTANLSIADLEVVGGELYTNGEYSHIYTQGDGAEIFTIGDQAQIYTQGSSANISASGDNATIYTAGINGSIFTTGANAGISTAGANATMGTLGTNATISTAGSAAHIQTSHASAAVKSTNFAAVESGGASLVDGSMQPCLTWSAGGRNLTIPSGTAVTFDSTSYTYGTGAAAAHRTALGLDTLLNAKANLAGGNTFTGAQTITGASLTLQNAGTVTLALNDTSNANIPVFNLQQLGTTRGRIEGGVGLTSRLDFSVGIPLSRSMSLNQGGTQNYGVTIGRSSISANVAPPTDGLHVQGSVAIGTTSPNSSAAVDITSTTKGFLPPRMTTAQRDVISSPPAGLVIYNTTTNNLNSYSGSAWVELVDSADLGTNVANFLATPTSANLASALTDENGTGGGFVRAEGATLTSPSLVGPVNLTSQDASTADRVMNRALFDFRLFEQSEGLWMFRQGDIIATNVGSGITDSNGGVSLFSGGTANSVSLARIHGGGTTALPMYRLDWSRPLVFSGFITASATTPNGIGRLLLGVPQATTTPVDLTNKGIGIRCVGSAITLVVHNGTTLTTSATVGTLSSAVQYFRIVCDGAGNVQLYLNKVLVASTSLGPTGAAVEVGLTASATNNADAAIQRFGCGLLKIWTL